MRTLLALILTIIAVTAAPVMAKDDCRSPDCGWLNTNNGDLTADSRPGSHDVAYRWRGWSHYKTRVQKICGSPGNTCTPETRRWLAGD